MKKSINALFYVLMILIFSNVIFAANDSSPEASLNFPEFDEIYALTDEIVDNMNKLISKKTPFTSDDFDFSHLYRNFDSTEIFENDADPREVFENAQNFKWRLFVEYKEKTLLFSISKGEGIEAGSRYADILEGKIQGTEEDYEKIEYIESVKGKYYVSSCIHDTTFFKNQFTIVAFEFCKDNKDCEVYLTGIPGLWYTEAAMYIDGDEIYVRLDTPIEIPEMGLKYERYEILTLDEAKELSRAALETISIRKKNGGISYGFPDNFIPDDFSFIKANARPVTTTDADTEQAEVKPVDNSHLVPIDEDNTRESEGNNFILIATLSVSIIAVCCIVFIVVIKLRKKQSF